MQSYKLNNFSKFTLLVIVSAACIGSALISPSLPFIAKHFGRDTNQTNILVSIYLFGYLFGQFIYSALARKLGYQPALKVGFIIFTISTLLQLVSIKIQSFELLYYSRLFCAFGAASGLICSFAIINEFSETRETPKLISMAFMSITLFSYLSITMGGILTQLLGLEGVFYALIMIATGMFFMISKFIPNLTPMDGRPKDSISDFFIIYCRSLLNKKLLSASLIVAFTTTSTYIYSALAPTISYEIFHLSPSCFGFFSVLNLVGLLLGGISSANLSKKYNSLHILMIGLSFSALPLVLFCLLNDYIFNLNNNGILFFMLTAILNFGLGLIYPAASYLSLNSIKCNVTASSVMNIIKIGCPAIAILSLNRLNMPLTNKFSTTLSLFFIITLCGFISLKFSE